MELSDALRIVGALADGHNPLTGQPLPDDHLCQQPQVVRALCLVVYQLRPADLLGVPARAMSVQPVADGVRPPELLGVPAAGLENAGKPWLPAEEAELVRAFDEGATVDELAGTHGRTRQAIHGRLYRLGKMPPGRWPPWEAVRPMAAAEVWWVLLPPGARGNGQGWLPSTQGGSVRFSCAPIKYHTPVSALIQALEEAGRPRRV